MGLLLSYFGLCGMNGERGTGIEFSPSTLIFPDLTIPAMLHATFY
jgi:hypothetical protein